MSSTSSLLSAIVVAFLLAIRWIFIRYAPGCGQTRSNVGKSTTRALPASWYSSKELYQLERRAIFSKKWMLVSHKLSLPEIGTWRRFEEAGFQFFLCKEGTGEIRGFHNICRHRAFPVVTEDSGKSKIFACKYHGWSYGLNGSLAKAPGYQDVENFDKSKNGLWPVHVHVDAHGFIWVNLDSATTASSTWEDDFNSVDQNPRHKEFDFDDYVFDHSWGMNGDYNWKTLADNYNECYHCATAHPDARAVSDLHAYKVETKGSIIEHFANTKPEQEKAGLKIVSNFYFPNACMTVSHKNSSDAEFEQINQMFKRILAEDKYLCNNAQKNLEAGVFMNGEMHPHMEKGPLYFQSMVRDLLTRHRNQEEKQGREVWPASRALPADALISKEDVQFCSGLACAMVGDSLKW
ncbi:hypothetical protein LTS08_008463 [Lithohypha guttulata]|nr:hypothetical protein LTS08_008463 [Lithohypha guttulata]